MKKHLGAVYVLIAGVMWGVFPMFTRLLYADGVSVKHAVASRAILAGAVYLVWGLFAGAFKGMKAKDWLFYLFYGVASSGSTYLFYALAIRYLSSAMAAMLLYTAPAFVILFCRVLYGDPITKVKLAALIATFAGSALVVRVYDLPSLKVSALGILFGLLSGVCYSMLTVIGRKAVERGGGTLRNSIVPAVCVGVIYGIAVPPWTIPVESARMVGCYLAVAVIGSVLPYFFYQKGLSTGMDGGTASLLAYAEPVTAAVLGCVCFGDLLEIWQIIGVVIVLIGAALPEVIKSPAPAEK